LGFVPRIYEAIVAFEKREVLCFTFQQDHSCWSLEDGRVRQRWKSWEQLEGCCVGPGKRKWLGWAIIIRVQMERSFLCKIHGRITWENNKWKKWKKRWLLWQTICIQF
jgi:hypothetical protein